MPCVLKDPFVTPSVLKDPFITPPVRKDPFVTLHGGPASRVDLAQ
jgi:hypothetical protein